MYIDFHTYIFPDSIAPRAIASLEKSGNVKAFSDGTKQGLLNSMEKYNISYSVLMPIATKASQTATINNVAIENNKEDKLFSFGSIHPDYENIDEELFKLKNAGIKGIKLHPDFQGIFINDKRFVRLMQKASEMGFLITIHGGYDISFPNVHRSTPERLASVLPEIKNPKIIVAHMGGYKYLDDVEKYLVGKKGIYFDTSYSIGKMDTEQIKRIILKSDPDKILFGSDSPWDSQKNAVTGIEMLDISSSLKDKILYKNACTLLNIEL